MEESSHVQACAGVPFYALWKKKELLYKEAAHRELLDRAKELDRHRAIKIPQLLVKEVAKVKLQEVEIPAEVLRLEDKVVALLIHQEMAQLQGKELVQVARMRVVHLPVGKVVAPQILRGMEVPVAKVKEAAQLTLMMAQPKLVGQEVDQLLQMEVVQLKDQAQAADQLVLEAKVVQLDRLLLPLLQLPLLQPPLHRLRVVQLLLDVKLVASERLQPVIARSLSLITCLCSLEVLVRLVKLRLVMPVGTTASACRLTTTRAFDYTIAIGNIYSGFPS